MIWLTFGDVRLKPDATGNGSVRLQADRGVMMSKRFLTAALFACVAGTFLSAQTAYKVPKTAWGDPDISGVYSNDDETGTPLERPAQFDGKRQEDFTPAELLA